MKQIKFSQKAKIYLRTLGFFTFLIILAVTVFRLASTQVPAQKNKLALQLKKEQALRQKTELLRTVETDIANQVDLTTFALPAKNSSFVVISQLNKLSQENLIILTNLKVGAETKEGNILSSDLSFDAEGTIFSVLTFLERIGEIAPITLIDKAQINQALGLARATVRVKVFWAEFPTSLPAISEPLADLTNEEKEVLLKVLNLTPPDFVSLEPESPRENPNPF